MDTRTIEGVSGRILRRSGQLSAPRLLAFLDERDLSERAYRTNWKHILRSLHFRLDESQAEARRELERAQGELALR